MSWMTRNTNREPVSQTCPMIDEVLKSIDLLIEDDKERKRLEEIMEHIRSHNGKLRDWGFGEARNVDELEDKISDLEKEIESLERQNRDLEKEVEYYKEA